MKHFVLGLAGGSLAGSLIALGNSSVKKRISVRLKDFYSELRNLSASLMQAKRDVERLNKDIPAAREAFRDLKYHFNDYQNYLGRRLGQMNSAASKMNSDLK